MSESNAVAAKINIPSAIVSIASPIAILVFSSQYLSEEYCKNDAALFIVVASAIALATAVVRIATAYFLPIEDKRAKYLGISGYLVNCVVIIWGSIVVFGAYSTWTHTDLSNANYCHFTPYVFAFIYLLVSWVTIPLILIVQGLFCVGCSLIYSDFETNRDRPCRNFVDLCFVVKNKVKK